MDEVEVFSGKPRFGDLNASASFRRGLGSMFFGSDLVLTIGMPLVAGLSLKQFAGVLGHEFGHFTQGTGMRLTYIVRSISYWFLRVVCQRDSWDEWLDELAQESDIRFAWVLWLAKLCVWVTRRILWLFMVLGQMVSGLLLRQMEFDADRHEARLVGSETFESTVRRLAVLGVAYQGAQDDLLRKVDLSIEAGRTGLFDTHPSDKERIASARREDAAGVFHTDRPAHELFCHFDALAKNLTWDFYRDVLGQGVRPDHLQPIEKLLAQQGGRVGCSPPKPYPPACLENVIACGS